MELYMMAKINKRREKNKQDKVMIGKVNVDRKKLIISSNA